MPLDRRSIVLGLAAALGACRGSESAIGVTCTLESRYDLYAGLLSPAPGASVTDSASFFVKELRGTPRPGQLAPRIQLGWYVGAAGVTDSVAAIHVHDATDGQVLLSLQVAPMAGAVARTNLPPGPPYDGPLPFDTFVQRLNAGQVYVDAHTAASGTQTAVRRATLRFRTSRDWHDACSE